MVFFQNDLFLNIFYQNPEVQEKIKSLYQNSLHMYICIYRVYFYVELIFYVEFNFYAEFDMKS